MSGIKLPALPPELLASVKDAPELKAHRKAKESDLAAAERLKLQSKADLQEADDIVEPLAEVIAQSILELLEIALTSQEGISAIGRVNKDIGKKSKAERSRSHFFIHHLDLGSNPGSNPFEALFTSPYSIDLAIYYAMDETHYLDVWAEGVNRRVLHPNNPLDAWIQTQFSKRRYEEMALSLTSGSHPKEQTDYVRKKAAPNLITPVAFELGKYPRVRDFMSKRGGGVFELFKDPKRQGELRRALWQRLPGLAGVPSTELIRAHTVLRPQDRGHHHALWQPVDASFKPKRKPGDGLHVRYPFVSTEGSGLLRMNFTYSPISRVSFAYGGCKVELVQKSFPCPEREAVNDVNIRSLSFRREKRPWFYPSEDGRIHVPENLDYRGVRAHIFSIEERFGKDGNASRGEGVVPFEALDWRVCGIDAFMERLKGGQYSVGYRFGDPSDLFVASSSFQVVPDDFSSNPSQK